MTGITHEDTRETRKRVFIPQGYMAKRQDIPLKKRRIRTCKTNNFSGTD